tara:strand:+ start:8889 stop:10034 length:1146 start_codon:yes stop_codon:yes gene_type:complete
MLTGINFSPPLYFTLNYFIQLIFPTSIEQLRIQSLIWSIIGVVFSFALARRLFGLLPAFIAIILVVSQSALLLSQTLEARHYSMFFACGALVLYIQEISFRKSDNKKIKVLNFFSHLSLSQVHYLGIIFSGLVGLSFLICSKNKNLLKKIPGSVLYSWFLTIPVYIFLLNQQSSHLGNWPKPNDLSDLLGIYNQPLNWLSLLFPVIVVLLFNSKLNEGLVTPVKNSNVHKFIKTTVILWIIVPVFLCMLSHITNLNLFVERYFIPKEAASIILVAWLLMNLYNRINVKSLDSGYITVVVICLLLIGLNLKRYAYVLEPDHNYHHKLLIKTDELYSDQVLIFKDDPSYFPNAYLRKGNYILEIKNKEYLSYYQDFSKKIQVK